MRQGVEHTLILEQQPNSSTIRSLKNSPEFYQAVCEIKRAEGSKIMSNRLNYFPHPFPPLKRIWPTVFADTYFFRHKTSYNLCPIDQEMR